LRTQKLLVSVTSVKKLAILSGRVIVKALAKVGYQEVRQRGSHIRLACPGRTSITVPDYKVVGRGLLRKILRDADLSVEEFTRLV